MRKFKKHKILMIVLGIFFALVAFSIVFVVFGIDQKVLKTPLNGTVISTEGESIEGAEVSIQGQIVYTDSSGNFAFADVNFGSYELSVTKNGFSSYRSTIKIRRFSNKAEISLKSEEFGEVLISFNSKDLSENPIDVRINNMNFPVAKTQSGFEVKTRRLLTGTYLLEVRSPDYIDSQTRFEVKPGSAEEVIWLIPAADLVTELEDYVSLQKVSPTSILLKTSSLKRQVGKEELVENRLELKDLAIDEPIELQIEHEGYLKKDIKVELKQGLNSLDKTSLVPEGRHLLVEGRFVRSVQIDGTLSKTIFEGSSDCEILGGKENVYLTKCGGVIAAITTTDTDYKLLKEFYWNSSQVDFLASENKLITIGYDPRELILVHSTSNSSVIYTHDKDIVSVISDSSGNIYFSDTEAIYKYNSISSISEEVIKGGYFLQNISTNKAQILAFSRNSSTQNNMWVIDLSSRESKKINFLPGNFSKLRFIRDNSIAYLNNRNLYAGQIDNGQQEVLKDVGSYWMNPAGSIYFAHKRQLGETVFATQQNTLEKPLRVVD